MILAKIYHGIDSFCSLKYNDDIGIKSIDSLPVFQTPALKGLSIYNLAGEQFEIGQNCIYAPATN